MMPAPRGRACAVPVLSRLGRAAFDLVVPLDCVGCGAPGGAWCPRCELACRGPALDVPGPMACRAVAAQGGPAGRAVVAFKDRGVRGLADPLGRMLAAAVRSVLADLDPPTDGPVWLIPMPSRPAARRERGFDHMAVLAARAARDLRRGGVPAHRCRLLAHARASRDQVGLSRHERWENVRGSLVASSPPGGLLVVVDDVTTTGATLAEAARALGCSGAAPRAAATITWATATLASGAEPG